MSDKPTNPARRPKRKRDPNHLAKQIVDEATGQAEPEYEPEKDPAAVELGRKGGEKGKYPGRLAVGQRALGRFVATP